MKKTHKLFFLAYGLIFLFMIFPIILAIIGSFGGLVFGCDSFNEGGVSGCMLSYLWYTLAMFPWFLFFTIPIGVILGIILALIHLIYSISSKKEKS